MKKSGILLLSLCILLATNAHEYVLIAHHFKVNRGDTLEIHLFVADGFNVELERPLQKQITRKFELLTQKGEEDLLAGNSEGRLPVLEKKVDFDGPGLIHLERDYAKITLDNQKFLEYLEEDHLENISIANSKNKEQRERYSRYIKCLIQSGPAGNDTIYKTLTGQALEIILLQNPYKLNPGSMLEARVFFQGKPLANKVITIRNRTGGQPATSQQSRTDANGTCSFTINRKGDWFIHTTHMIPCPEPAEADWESFWASYSFGIE